MTTDPTSRPVPRPTARETTPDVDAPTPPVGLETVPNADLPSVATTSIGMPAEDATSATPPVGGSATDATTTPTRTGGRPAAADRSTGDLLRTVTDNVRSLVQGEVASAQQEMAEKAREAQPAAAMLGGAAVLGVLAAGTSAVVLVRALDRILPPATSALVATALLGGGAAALTAAGVEQLRRVGPPVPERTIESVKADVAAVAEATPR